MAQILIAEDQDSVREFIIRTLEMHGHTVRSAKDGAEAYDILQHGGTEVLVSDIRMPIMDGISLALKAKGEQPDIKILLITGYSAELKRAYNISQLVDGILSKPFTAEQIHEAVLGVLSVNKQMA